MVDLKKVRRMMMKGFDAIANGKALDDLVYDSSDLGREMVIGRALTFGESLTEDFNERSLRWCSALFPGSKRSHHRKARESVAHI
jgi:hypothetical protein